ncbi:hypothetical protein EUX98_g7877 [Antrodiella citrinella]|uniref:SMP-LTD domain-containing protein n=1 Tax=Antrodiella citrinella TaxID=2447956 RepID=A0A4S4MKR2_9APHY|nr:hypothetical protein EUX98_g7877 [Antrodiella citrinella]
MSLKALIYAYVLGGITFIPLVLFGLVCYTLYTSVPIGDLDPAKLTRGNLEKRATDGTDQDKGSAEVTAFDLNDLPRHRKGWLTVRRTFEETPTEGTYVGFVRGFLDARSKDPKRSRPKDMWYVVLKGTVLYLYEDESMTECEAAVEVGGHEVVIYPEGLLDGELFAKRNAICLKPKASDTETEVPSVTKEMQFAEGDREEAEKAVEGATTSKEKAKAEQLAEVERKREDARAEALDRSTPWFIFLRSNVEMEDWYLALIHASDNPPNSSTLAPLEGVFRPADMATLVSTIDEQPDVIPMRWLNALIGRLFFSFYRTQHLENYIIGRFMRKLDKIKRPGFLTHIVVREVSVGNTAPTFSKPMLKELTREGDAALEVHMHYKGEVRITIEAVATINLGARFKSYAVKLVLAVVLREMEGNLLIKVKRPPSNRMWYAFTTTPRMVLDVEPVVSDRQLTWSMILSTIESKLKEVIQESIVLPNMDDIAFFESRKYAHRGGIWSDASRQEKSSTLFPTPPASVVDDDKSTASEPILQSQTASASSTATPEPIPPLQRSFSVEGTQVEANSTSTLQDSSSPPRPATTTNLLGMTLNESSSFRRRTWFGGSWNEDPENVEGTDASHRGRQDRADEDISRKSSSTRSSHSTSGEAVQAFSQEDDVNLKLIPPDIPRRSHSHSFSAQNIAGPSSESLSTSAPGESSMTSFRPQSPPQPGPGGAEKGSPMSPTFFQTLKSRDKQAISNTAKETMRKWGVNWGSLRKGNEAGNSPATARDSFSDENPEAKVESMKVHKPRPSYAEVRAAVVQRKEKHGDASATDSHSSDADDPRTNEAFSFSRGQTLFPAYSGDSTLSPSTSPRPGGDGQDSSPSSRSVSPAQRPRTLSRRSNGPEGLPNVDDQPPAVPIHTQPPRPKTMSIPSIHVSHRGDVMSMGYAPPPPPPEPKKAAPVAIQSVYRLWQKPAQENEQESKGSQEVTPQGARSHDDITVPPAASPSPPSFEPSGATPPGRLAPPPLPPRSTATPVSRMAQTEPSKPTVDGEREVSPASQALQSIVTKDRTKRASLEPLPPKPTPPPLPERRKSVTTAATDSIEASSGSNVYASLNGDSSSNGRPMADNGGVTASPKAPALPPRRIAQPST